MEAWLKQESAALQAQSPEFKPQYHQKKREREMVWEAEVWF
jgi:hypothetical protein